VRRLRARITTEKSASVRPGRQRHDL